MSETLSNFYNVKYYNAEEVEKNRFQKLLDVNLKNFLLKLIVFII